MKFVILRRIFLFSLCLHMLCFLLAEQTQNKLFFQAGALIMWVPSFALVVNIFFRLQQKKGLELCENVYGKLREIYGINIFLEWKDPNAHMALEYLRKALHYHLTAFPDDASLPLIVECREYIESFDEECRRRTVAT